jgi:hypothetical protein
MFGGDKMRESIIAMVVGPLEDPNGEVTVAVIGP